MAEVELVEEEAGELGSGIGVRAMLGAELPGIEQEFVSDLVFGGVNIGLTMGEDVPDGAPYDMAARSRPGFCER